MTMKQLDTVALINALPEHNLAHTSRRRIVFRKCDTEDDFFARGREVARLTDQGLPIPHRSIRSFGNAKQRKKFRLATAHAWLANLEAGQAAELPFMQSRRPFHAIPGIFR